MHSLNLSLSLPAPWSNQQLSIAQVGYINYLVGPNGSGKSRFSKTLQSTLGNARLLGTDRLSGMEQVNALRNLFGDNFSSGFSKSHFSHFKNAGKEGSGIDTLIMLEERMDLRIQVEATLSHLFNRKITLEWDSGHLLAKAILGSSGASYRLDREECHGIKELLVLLTHLYNDEHTYLIIDEPELNLHPQYQAFFMQEVRKIAGAPQTGTNKKIIFLITHSPFILDFKTVDDVKSVISFSIDHQAPKQIYDIDSNRTARIESLVPRLNVHHKQLFFSDNPIFVEGILDAQFISALQEARGVSVAGAGSCIIDAGGCEEVNRYLELCISFGKKAHFVYDLDSLFFGNLKSCIKNEGEIQSFLVTAGVGSDFAKYCGALETKLSETIKKLLDLPSTSPLLATLITYFRSLGEVRKWGSKDHAKARVALLSAINRLEKEFADIIPDADIADIKGRLKKIVTALKEKNIYLLPGGALERYLPSYTGNPYDLKDELKRAAVNDELKELSKNLSEQNLRARYGELFEIVCLLPSKLSVDIDQIVRSYLSQYIHDLQQTIINNPSWTQEQIQSHLNNNIQKSTAKVFWIQDLKKVNNQNFSVRVRISRMLGEVEREVIVTDKTNAGIGEFTIMNA